MMRGVKIGLLVVAGLVVALMTLRVTGLEPPYVDPGSEVWGRVNGCEADHFTVKAPGGEGKLPDDPIRHGASILTFETRGLW